MNKLTQLQKKCKYGVLVFINAHRDYHQTAEEALEEDLELDLTEEVVRKMVETNTIIHCSFAPERPDIVMDVYHYDLDKCFDECLAMLD